MDWGSIRANLDLTTPSSANGLETVSEKSQRWDLPVLVFIQTVLVASSAAQPVSHESRFALAAWTLPPPVSRVWHIHLVSSDLAANLSLAQYAPRPSL